MLKIYTKTGDGGETSLFGGKRVRKNDLKIEVLGEIDELNSVIGVAVAEVSSIKYQVLSIEEELFKIQKDLFKIGTMLAMNNEQRTTNNLKRRIEKFEEMIDKLSKKLPEIKNFILPGGGEVGSVLHFARAVCRRAERQIVTLSQKEKVESAILAYFNRLSDLLFVMARFVNYQEKEKEIVWIKN